MKTFKYFKSNLCNESYGEISNDDIYGRLKLPKGKLTIRHKAMRNVFQAFAGTTYITGASGDYPEDAARELVNQYDVDAGTKITVYGHKDPSVILVPEIEDYVAEYLLKKRKR